MSSKLNQVSIDTFSPEDLKGLFEHICVEILHSTPFKIKSDILKLKGTSKELEGHNPTIQSILTLIATYDLKFELFIRYSEAVKPSFSGIDHEDNSVVRDMRAQEKEIIDPPEKVVREIKPLPPEKKEESVKKEVSDDAIPDFE